MTGHSGGSRNSLSRRVFIRAVGATGAGFALFAWMLGGGLIYTAGIVFYLYDERFKHWHGFWHLCVLAGSAVLISVLL